MMCSKCWHSKEVHTRVDCWFPDGYEGDEDWTNSGCEWESDNEKCFCLQFEEDNWTGSNATINFEE